MTMRILLHHDVDRAAIDALALALGWRLVSVLAGTDSRLRQVVFAGSDALITFVDDHRVRYLSVLGHDPAPIVETVRAALPCLELREVLAMHADDPTRALPWLGVVAPEEASEPILGLVRGALATDDPALREAVRMAAELSGWPELGADSSLRAPRPERPRLSHSVLARLHVVDGEEKVILHEPRTGAVLEIDRESYRALELADGTRDLDALALALAREGRYRGEADLKQLLTELDDAGVLEDGLVMAPPAPPVAPPVTPANRPLEVLDYTLVCDGEGSCCRFYGSVAFSPRDSLRARSVADEMALPTDALFTPIRGAQMDEDAVQVVAQIDGRCAFLEGDGRCGIHRRAGSAAKPFPCSFYPAMLMDDGAAIRVSLGPECACIFASVGRADGTPLVPVAARTLADLPPGVSVMHVPDPVPLSSRRTASRDALREWSARLVDALSSQSLDAAALAWRLAGVVAEEGLAVDALDRALREDTRELDGVEDWMRALGAQAAGSAVTQESWRSATDLSRAVARWIADSLETVELREASDPGAERFYLRALAYGHRLAVEGRPLSVGLRDRAARILTARAMAKIPPPPHASARYPLALLEAAMRNLALSGYADHL